jgi:hypothetical protein
LRILPDLAAFCRVKSFISFSCNISARTGSHEVEGSNPTLSARLSRPAVG